jgi:hypothetical protein
MAMQLEVANLYTESLQLKMKFEVLTESVEEDSGIPRTKLQQCKLIIRLFEISLFTSFKVDSSFAD